MWVLVGVFVLVANLNFSFCCSNVKKVSNCKYWKGLGFCLSDSPHYASMQTYCQKECGHCQQPAFPGCKDRGNYCNIYKDYCSDPNYIEYLKGECKNTCNFCHITTTPPPTTPTTLPYTGSGGRAIQPGCGHKGPSHTRIVGGKNAKPGDWPWQVNIDYRHNTVNPGHLCGGTLINEEWVLSAAHCFYGDQNKNNYWLKLGEHDLKTENGWEQTFGIRELILHPKYQHNGHDYDLALLRLNTTAQLNERVRTACLAGENISFPLTTQCYITGWGLLKESGNGPAILQQTRVPLVNHGKCSAAYNPLHYKVTPRMLCAGYEDGRSDACDGDSGGPLICKYSDVTRKEEVWYLWGAISWGVGCARKGLYGVFANVQSMRPWIDSYVFSS